MLQSRRAYLVCLGEQYAFVYEKINQQHQQQHREAIEIYYYSPRLMEVTHAREFGLYGTVVPETTVIPETNCTSFLHVHANFWYQKLSKHNCVVWLVRTRSQFSAQELVHYHQNPSGMSSRSRDSDCLETCQRLQWRSQTRCVRQENTYFCVGYIHAILNNFPSTT